MSWTILLGQFILPKTCKNSEIRLSLSFLSHHGFCWIPMMRMDRTVLFFSFSLSGPVLGLIIIVHHHHSSSFQYMPKMRVYILYCMNHHIT